MLKRDECTGCFACVNVCPQKCIKTVESKDGFLYPEIDNNLCINCKLCEKVCPLEKEKKVCSDTVVFAAYNFDMNTRMTSSSGGFFPLVAEYVLEKEGVVFGAVISENGREVYHISIKSKNDLYKLKGSKYVQSNIKDCFEKAEILLKEGRIVLFSGTPCQIAGLKTFLKSDYDNLYTLDVICHGVPSPMVWRKYLDDMEGENDSIVESVDFRNKTTGWKQYSLKVIMKNKIELRSKITENSYLKGFVNSLYLRESCYKCVFKNGNYYSDITLGDFWGIEDVLPENNDNKGMSVVVIHSEQGIKLFDNLKKNIFYKQMTEKEALNKNISYYNSSQKNPMKKVFLEDLKKYDFERAFKKYYSKSIVSKIRRKYYAIKAKIGEA